MEYGLLTDFYELTMGQALYKSNKHLEDTTFDGFFRKCPDGGNYVITAFLEEAIKYIKDFKINDEEIEYLKSTNQFDEDYLEYLRTIKFTGSIEAIPDGTVVFPNEPVFTVKAKAIEAMLIETRLLQIMNFAGLITTKASRIVRAAKDRPVMEFGARRAQESAASLLGAKYAYIGGCSSTSNTKAGQLYNIPISGTMAHSFVMMFDSEYEAFLAYAKAFPNNCVLLVDTYDTLNSGVTNAIRVAKEYLIPNGYRLKGIRLDSGDLAYLSTCARMELNLAGLNDCKIVASNGLDEYLIEDLIAQGAKIDSFGVGENLITAASDPVFGGVYKMSELNGEAKIKISNNVGKITNPGAKKTVRFYDSLTNMALADVIFRSEESIPNGEEFTTFSERATWKHTELNNYRTRVLQVPIFENGKLVYQIPSVDEIKAKTREELLTLYEEVKRFKNPQEYYVNLSKQLYDLKHKLLHDENAMKLEKKNGQANS